MCSGAGPPALAHLFPDLLLTRSSLQEDPFGVGLKDEGGALHPMVAQLVKRLRVARWRVVQTAAECDMDILLRFTPLKAGGQEFMLSFRFSRVVEHVFRAGSDQRERQTTVRYQVRAWRRDTPGSGVDLVLYKMAKDGDLPPDDEREQRGGPSDDGAKPGEGAGAGAGKEVEVEVEVDGSDSDEKDIQIMLAVEEEGLEWAGSAMGLEMEVPGVLLLLMSFPCSEEEWHVERAILERVLGDDDDEDEDGDENDEGDEGDEGKEPAVEDA